VQYLFDYRTISASAFAALHMMHWPPSPFYMLDSQRKVNEKRATVVLGSNMAPEFEMAPRHRHQ